MWHIKMSKAARISSLLVHIISLFKYEPAILLLSVYPKELKAVIQTNTLNPHYWQILDLWIHLHTKVYS